MVDSNPSAVCDGVVEIRPEVDRSATGLTRFDCSWFPNVSVSLECVRGEYCCNELDKCTRGDCSCCGWSGDMPTSGGGRPSVGEPKLRRSMCAEEGVMVVVAGLILPRGVDGEGFMKDMLLVSFEPSSWLACPLWETTGEWECAEEERRGEWNEGSI